MHEIMASVTTSPSTTELRRIFAVSPSATLAVDAKAKALQAARARDRLRRGRAGLPDAGPHRRRLEWSRTRRDPANHHYTPTSGIPALREAIAAKTKRDSGLEIAAGQVLVTNGGKQAVANVRRPMRPR